MARIAFLLDEDFEDVEFRVPFERLQEAGHEVTVIGKRPGVKVSGKQGEERVTVQEEAGRCDPAEFDALVIPGGYSPDKLRLDPGAVEFTRKFGKSGKTVAAVCHGGSLLIDADLVRDRRVTSWPSIRVDLENAGAHWENDPVVEDANLICSRQPSDLEAFSSAILRRLGRGGG